MVAMSVQDFSLIAPRFIGERFGGLNAVTGSPSFEY